MDDFQRGPSGGNKILPMINRHNLRPFRRMANWINNPKRSSTIGCIFLLVTNALFLILTITFALLYFNKGGEGEEEKPTFGGNMPNWNAPTHSLLGEYSKAGVAADNEICSNIGRGILLQGGNAVEAAIATQFCIGIMDTHSAGLGGGHLMTFYNATTKKCHVIDAREMAPLNSTEDMFVGRMDKSERGPESVAVPGEVHGFWTEYTHFGGNLDWHTLLDPTIKLVEEGYPASHALSGYLKKKQEQILSRPGMKARLVNPATGTVYGPGEQIKTRQDLAETMRKLANASDPVELFYKGDMAKAIVAEFRANGGRLTMDDLANYRALIRPDSEVIYTHLSGGRTLCGPPPPSSSAVTQGIINILDPISFNLNTFPGRVDFLHRYIEASKFAYAVRNSLGDMDFVPDAMELAKKITGPEWAQLVRSKITSSTHDDAYYDAGIPQFQEDHGTAHVSVVDRWGNAVAVTSSLNLAFGSMEISDATGILWNDQMNDFSSPGASNYWGYPPSPKNFIKPGKRPMSSMSPMVIFNRDDGKKEVLAIGGSGGSTIISGVAAAAFQALWLDANIKEAIDFPRFHNQLRPNCTNIEARIPREYLEALTARGHRFEPSKEGGFFNVVTGVHRLEDGTIQANSDWRKGWESQPAGY